MSSDTHSSWRVLLVPVLICGAITVHTARSPARADDAAKPDPAARKEMYTKWMKEYADLTKISVGPRTDRDQGFKLFPTPVFRYSDEPRNIPDATLWVWTNDGRPVALQKIEGNNWGNGRQWTICFASLSDELITASWPNNRSYTARTPGVKFLPIPNADAPAETARARTQQLKALKDRFTGRLDVLDDGKGGAETRTMSKAIFEYDDPRTKLPLGAIFGLSSTGTNPDIYLLIEARRGSDNKLQWDYTYARMTASSIRLRLDDEEVAAEGPVPTSGSPIAAFERWCFYFMPRDFY